MAFTGLTKTCNHLWGKYIYKPFRSYTGHFRSLPTFLIIGAQKAGTTSLWYYLNQHPQIRMSQKKEVHYFDQNYQNSTAWYKSHFAWRSDKKYVIGEATPYYLFHPLAPSRVHKLLPDIKLIVLLRNPTDRAYAHYQMLRRKKLEPSEDFKAACQLEQVRILGEKERIMAEPFYHSYAHQRYTYLKRGEYASQLKNWQRYFQQNQFLILKSEAFFENPQKELDKIGAFLQIDEFDFKELGSVNPGNYKPMHDNYRKWLNQYFKPYNEALQMEVDWPVDWF